VQVSHCLTSSLVVWRTVWNGLRTVDMTSRKDSPLVMTNVLSEKVSRENADPPFVFRVDREEQIEHR
jgi:hypothetical protein